MLELPVRSDIYDYEFRTSLDGTIYTIRTHYNTRMNRWVMDFKTADNIPIVLGIPLLLGTSLLSNYSDDRLPKGLLFLINIESENEECGMDDLGKNCLLLYEELF